MSSSSSPAYPDSTEHHAQGYYTDRSGDITNNANTDYEQLRRQLAAQQKAYAASRKRLAAQGAALREAEQEMIGSLQRAGGAGDID